MSLYRKGNPDENGTPAKGKAQSLGPASGKDQPTGGASGNSTPQRSATVVSGGGWFVDKRGHVESENILIDLCDDEPSTPSTNVRTF